MLANYVKLALKVLGRRKFFTFISLFGISLTLVVLMVATAILDNIFEPRKPESRFDRVLTVSRVKVSGKDMTMSGNPGYRLIAKHMLGLAGAEVTSVATESNRLAMYHEGRKIETHVRRTDGAYWQITDFRFLEGGPYSEADNRDARYVAVITDGMRSKLFGNAKGLGRTFSLEGQTYRVVGVVPDVSVTRLVAFSQIWMPVRTLRTRDYERSLVGSFIGLVLARDRADFPRLRAEFRGRLDGVTFDDPVMFNRIETALDTPFESFARTALGDLADDKRAAAMRVVLALATLLFLALPTINLVSINLSRIMERAPEIGVRKAFGASSRTLVGQFVVENIVLTLIGGAIAFALSLLVLPGLRVIELIPHAEFDVNLRIFAYGMLLAALFGVVSGVYPAWRMSRMQAVDALRGGAQ